MNELLESPNENELTPPPAPISALGPDALARRGRGSRRHGALDLRPALDPTALGALGVDLLGGLHQHDAGKGGEPGLPGLLPRGRGAPRHAPRRHPADAAPGV